eukprot:TRINITY_DN930_c0_g4_i3.p2 TRINITY_DN930_c0_g4~~TRINITY_DN930_c0_g4_i3.p2  ORF type:complete len:148 (-),score=40.10 TRINITY_DN930_c0_g4_i3:19-462(-)
MFQAKMATKGASMKARQYSWNKWARIGAILSALVLMILAIVTVASPEAAAGNGGANGVFAVISIIFCIVIFTLEIPIPFINTFCGLMDNLKYRTGLYLIFAIFGFIFPMGVLGAVLLLLTLVVMGMGILAKQDPAVTSKSETVPPAI